MKSLIKFNIIDMTSNCIVLLFAAWIADQLIHLNLNSVQGQLNFCDPTPRAMPFLKDSVVYKTYTN